MAFLEAVNRFVWGVPALFMILIVGTYLTIHTRFAQLRLFPKALQSFLHQCRHAGSGYRALCTALAATVGTGNLAGVAGAIALGGPGAVFWMWVSGILGMITKFAEAVLSIRYRHISGSGELTGGPMYMIRKGMHKRWHWLAGIYCFFGVVASFGVGNATQINTVLGGIDSVMQYLGYSLGPYERVMIGCVLAILICFMLYGGAARIGSAAEKLVPLASLGYLLLCVIVIVLRADSLPKVFRTIITGAFTPRAVTGGAVGSVMCALRVGTARGVFTNEAGMGTAAIAHAGADVAHPVAQGLMGIMEVFIDTIVICTMTALVILCSDVPIFYGVDPGISLTNQAFSAIYGPWVTIPLTAALILFAVATVLGWGLYGIRCAQYLFGDGVWKRFVWLQGIGVVIGSVLGTGTVWLIAEIVNGLMAIPNLIAVAALSPELFRIIRSWDETTGL